MSDKFNTQLILNAYTGKIIRYYMEHKTIPSIAEMQKMRDETIDESESESWNQGIVALGQRKRD